jgi:hypothetical protein
MLFLLFLGTVGALQFSERLNSVIPSLKTTHSSEFASVFDKTAGLGFEPVHFNEAK